MVIIVNPQAGRGRSGRIVEKIEKLCREAGQPTKTFLTSGPGDATELSRKLVAAGHRRVVAMGGDGTIREVGGGLLGSGVELGLIPIGRGNDLARSLNVPINEPSRALRVLQRGRIKEIDVGWDGRECFLSVMGIGYPALVAEQTNQLRWIQGRASFLVSVYKALRRMRVVEVRVTLDDSRLEVGCTSILIHNTPFTGGGLKMAPMARLEDGFFDVVVIDAVGIWDLMLNFPRVYWGRHLSHPSFRHYRSRTVKVSSDSPVPMMRDGDPAGTLPVEACVLPRALKVIVPEEQN